MKQLFDKLKSLKHILLLSFLCFSLSFLFILIHSHAQNSNEEADSQLSNFIGQQSEYEQSSFSLPDSADSINEILLPLSATEQTSYSMVSTSEEMRGVWISYLELMGKCGTESEFTALVNTMMENCKKLRMNAVFVHVRPFSDALYPSDYFPWSKVVTGTQGVNPGYDPLKIMLQAAHEHGLEFHAWINPYRITSSGNTDIKTLSKDNPARIWAQSSKLSDRRKVLSYGGMLQYNPSKKAVRKLIINGVKEIAVKYDIDGIHFDDYFYPNLGTDYKKNFDYKEYQAYKERCKKACKTPLSIVKWRRRNVDLLIKGVYDEISRINKKMGKDVVFGVSPQGQIQNLYVKNSLYCDVKKWMSEKGYIDYVCPQVYWSFSQKIAPFDKMVDDWSNCKKRKSVSLYIGMAAYRAGISKQEANALGDPGWSKSNTVLKREVQYIRNKSNISGFFLYRYDNIVSTTAKKEIKNLLTILK